MRKPIIKKADAIKADQLLQAWLESVGAVRGDVTKACIENGWPIDCPKYLVHTLHGPLSVYPSSSHNPTKSGYVCYMQFQDPSQSDGFCGGNKLSGKWNQYAWASDGVLTPDEWVGYIQRQLNYAGHQLRAAQ